MKQTTKSKAATRYFPINIEKQWCPGGEGGSLEVKSPIRKTIIYNDFCYGILHLIKLISVIIFIYLFVKK